MSAIVSVYATFPTIEEARRIGRLAVEERLAACVNILGDCHSIYRWNGSVEESGEVAALFKTAAASADRLIARIADLHGFDVPAIMVWPIANARQSYVEWVIESTR